MSNLVEAPDLDAALGWLNTDRPLRLRDELRGQVVVLDFWTYCCANCMHVLPDLAYLEDKYRHEPVTFIGVHSAKFSNEASLETIRAAIHRYEIKHPVAVDDNMKIWRSYGVRSWPTLIVIDGAGFVRFAVAGEGNRDALDHAVAAALEQGRAGGTLADGPLALRREASARSASGLAFPGKVLADVGADRLYVADSNHNRIVVAALPDAEGRAQVIRVIGSGRVGRDDGPAPSASFNHPQGLAAGHGNLYVADTENHLIRAIDLTSWETTTLVGTGELSNDCAGGGMGTQQGLNSPWDLCLEGATLYVAMAGRHQIWRVDLPVGFARALAGTGRENIVDGPAETAAFAQPSGLCLMGGKLYIADSEVSAIRGIDLTAERVFTVIGEGLFSFGDVDGTYPQAKLQHPLGVDAWHRELVVADTYNHKIKSVDPASRSSRTLFGSGRIGPSTPEGGVAFFEPGGLSVAGDDLFVADTNHHRIVRIHLVSGLWHEIMFEGLESPRCVPRSVQGEAEVKEPRFPAEPLADAESANSAESVSVATGKDVELVLDIKLPDEAHLSPEAPWSVRVTVDGTGVLQHTGKSDSPPLRVTIPRKAVLTGVPWRVCASFAYCTQGASNLCIPVQYVWLLAVTEGDTSEVLLSVTP